MISTPKKLVIIGDSGVFGWGDLDGGGWSERLRLAWMKAPIAPVVYPLGIRGDGLERVAKRWKQEWETRGELKRSVPGAILISVGLNDTARIGRPDGRPQLTSEAYRFGLMQLLKEIKREAKVFVVGLTPVEESAMPFANCLWYSNQAGAIYEAQIEDVCIELDVPFLALHEKMLSEDDWKQWIEPDGIHLNQEGHYWLYKRLISWQPLLSWAELEEITNVTQTIL